MIERAKEAEAYLIVLVEDTLTNSLSFPFLKQISKKIKATPESGESGALGQNDDLL